MSLIDVLILTKMKSSVHHANELFNILVLIGWPQCAIMPMQSLHSHLSTYFEAFSKSIKLTNDNYEVPSVQGAWRYVVPVVVHGAWSYVVPAVVCKARIVT